MSLLYARHALAASFIRSIVARTLRVHVLQPKDRACARGCSRKKNAGSEDINSPRSPLGTTLGGPEGWTGHTTADPTSAVLYYNKYADPLHPNYAEMAHGTLDEFRGHNWAVEVGPSGTQTEHRFVQGDVPCGYPRAGNGTPLEGSAARRAPAAHSTSRSRTSGVQRSSALALRLAAVCGARSATTGRRRLPTTKPPASASRIRYARYTVRIATPTAIRRSRMAIRCVWRSTMLAEHAFGVRAPGTPCATTQQPISSTSHSKP